MDAKQSVGITVGINDLQSSRFISFGTFNGPGTSPVSEETIFEIGSVTKIFTATVLADMVSRREVALEDPVAQYLPPEVRLSSHDGKRIRLLDLSIPMTLGAFGDGFETRSIPCGGRRAHRS